MRITLLLIIAAISGCATTPTVNSNDYSDLYAGRSQVAFATQLPAMSAKEALVRGDQAYRKGDLDQALYHYLTAVHKDDVSPIPFHRIGIVHQQRGNLELAARAFSYALKRDRNHADTLEQLGLVLLHGRKPEAARVYLERALIADDKRVRSHNGMGVIADLAGDHAVAAEHYRQAIELKPGDTRVLNNLGYSLYLSGDWAGAEKYLKEVLRIEPDHELAIRNLALLEVRRQNPDTALALLERVMSKATANNDVGYLCMLDGQHELAAKYFSTAIRLSPSYYELAQDNLERNQKLAQEAQDGLGRYFADRAAGESTPASPAVESNP
ncbi:MAG: tetratricopeptide repeat protein, partial [Gammaproteobacteria bacterium]|nr:tetratricopeptide repeat protein [Gammaproteobacteria bacterium]